MKLSLLLLIPSVLAATLNVGAGKTYTTITAAYNAAAAGDTIYVYPGTYKEKLVFTKASITLKGAAYPAKNPSANTALITYATYASDAGSNDKSATLLVSGTNFKMYNINVTNTAGTAGQAIALSATGTKQGFYSSAIIGWQDTLYAHLGTQFFGACYVEGAVDFVFGTTGTSWYQGVTLGVVRKASLLTAQGRDFGTETGYFVFDKAKVVLGKGAASSIKGTALLGRPWGDFARVVFQNSNLNNMITSAGWQAWNSEQDTSNVLFAEYANTNGAGTRVSFAKKLTSAVSISTILPDYSSWVDANFIGIGAN